MYKLLRPILFSLPPETAHAFTLNALHHIPSLFFPNIPKNPVSTMGLTFDHPVGLAAGLDKNAEHLDALSKLGFSFIEVGTVTPKPQEGNPKPRLFRIKNAQALINRMGFNNKGVDILIENVKRSNYQGILGINIGKNKDTPLSAAKEDYLYSLGKIYQYASYITINISSPNTPQLRELQKETYLNELLQQLKTAQLKLADRHKLYVPLVIKLSPDETYEDLKRIASSILIHKMDGIIATNTTQDHHAVQKMRYGQEKGGLSGKPLAKRSTECIQIIKEVVGDDLCLVGVGGIDNPKLAQEKMNAGAQLVQLYSGLIYQGPSLIKNICASI